MSDIKVYLVNQGFVCKLETLQATDKIYLQQFLNKMKLKHIPKMGQPIIRRLYTEVTINSNKYITIPRQYVHELIKHYGAVLQIKLPEIKYIDNLPDITAEFTYNQTLVISNLMDNYFTPTKIKDGTASCVLNVFAGFGKTYVAGGLIDHLKMRTLYVVPTKLLAEQAYNDLIKMFPNTNITIGKKTGDINIIVINSLVAVPIDYIKQYSFIIYDEVHGYCSSVFMETFWKHQTWVMLGMSATTNARNDGFDPIYTSLIGPIVYADKIESFENNDVNFNSSVNVINYHCPDEYNKMIKHEKTGKLFVPYLIKQFFTDPHRNKLILNIINELYNWTEDGKYHNIFVFCESREPLISLKEEIINAGINEDIDILSDEVDTFIGGITTTQINKIKKSSRILLSTYRYAGTGTSIPKMTAIVLISPRKTGLTQNVARILRRSGDPTIPRIVIDIVDVKSPLRNQLKYRLPAYENYKMDISYKKVLYSDISTQ